MQAKSDAAERDLKQKTAQLTSVQAKLALAEGKLGEARNRLAKTQRELANAEAASNRVAQIVRDQQQAIVDLGNEKLQYQRQTSDLRSRQLILRQGDEIVRGVIPHKARLGTRLELLNLLTKASDKAEDLGAVKGANGRAVSVVYRQVVGSGGAELYSADERNCLEMVLDKISHTPLVDTLVQVVCERNTLAGEQAPVELRLYVNNVVYLKGEKITSGRIDGKMSEGRILLAVIDFLQKRVTEAALRSGIIPISNPDPRYNAGQNPQDQVEGLMAVVDRIKAANARVTVDVYAGKNVYAADPLNMNNMIFEVSY